MRLLGSFVALGALVACSDHGFNSVNDADANGPVIEVDPPSIDFGAVTSEQSVVVETFTIKSVGKSDLDVDSIRIEGSSALSFTLLSEETAFVLPAGAEREVEVAFEPMGSSNQVAQALVASNDLSNPLVPVDLFGSAAVPELAIDPSPADFGTTYVGCDKSMPINIRSVGAEPVTVDGIANSGDGYSISYDFQLPQTLAPGESLVVDMTFEPNDETDFPGALEVTSNEPLGARTAEQIGAGKFAGEYTDEWQLDETKVDLMFFVDQSCSMDDDAAAVASNFAYFINQLSAYASNWQVIVANDYDGCNGSGVLTPSTANYEALFGNAVQSNDTECEAGLTAAAEAVDKTDPGECNYGFLREDALLHVVMVSDEVEQSIGGWAAKVDEIIAKKGSESLVRLSAVAGDYPSGCATADPGMGYYEAVNATGGTYLSICSDWSSSMEALAEASVYKDTYELTHDAVEPTIVVTIDGNVVNIGWHYDEATNSVVFDEAHVPEEGSTVTIDYAGYATCD